MRSVFLFVCLAAVVSAQGVGSCGVYLNVIADGTSTHAAVGSVPGGPGTGTGMSPYDSGNPYVAWATPGSNIKIRLSVPAGFPYSGGFGGGSVISLFWSTFGQGATPIQILLPSNAVQACDPNQPWNISVLPIGGAILDGIGFLSPPSPYFVPMDPGYPGFTEINTVFPSFFALPDYAVLQALILTPNGDFAVSNGVTIAPLAQNPYESSVLASLIPVSPSNPATQRGWVPQATPPGFKFFGTAAPNVNISTKGTLDFASPATPSGADGYSGSSALGCNPSDPDAHPRVAVNQLDYDLAVSPGSYTGPLSPSDITVEVAPPGPTWPTRLIVRWKRACYSYDPTQHSSFVCELWGNDSNFGPQPTDGLIVIEKQQLVGTYGAFGITGIGPGNAGQGFGGPASACNNLLFATWVNCCSWTQQAAEATLLSFQFDYGSNIGIENLALVFTPLHVGIPDAYNLKPQ